MGMARSPLNLLVTVTLSALFGPFLCLRAEEAEVAVEEKIPSTVSYYRDVRPIFQEHCQGCHQPAKAQGKYVVTSYGELIKEGKSQEVMVVPGDPKASLLFTELLSIDGEEPSMPKKRDPLTAEQVELIGRWIAEGAKDDSPETEVLFTRESPPSYKKPPVLTALDYSSDGELLAVSGFHEVLLYKVGDFEMTQRLVGMSPHIESLAFSPDSTYLAATGGSPGRTGEVQVWNVERSRLKLSLPMTYDTVYGAAWSSDGRLLAFGCADNTLRAIEVRTGEQVLYQGAHNDWVLDTAFSMDASHIVSVSRDRSLKLTEVGTQQFIDNITSITPGALRGGLMAVDRHPKKDELLVGGADGAPKIYKMYRTKARKIGDDFNLVRKFDPLPGRVFSAEYSQDGERIVAGSSLNGRGEVHVYREEDGELLSSFEVASGGVYATTFSSDGKHVAAGGFDGIVRVIDVDTGNLVKQFASVPLIGDEETDKGAGQETLRTRRL